MILEIKVPSPGESINEVEISNWLVADGVYVEKDQEICEIDSDKATLTVSAEDSGQIKLLKDAEIIISVGDTICTIDTSVQGKSTKKSVKKDTQKTQPKPPSLSTLLDKIEEDHREEFSEEAASGS